MRVLARRRPLATFALLALSIATVCAGIVRSRAFAANPDVAAWGVTFDLTISIPLLYWWSFVRTGRARALTIAPVFIAGTLVAAWLLPAAQQHFVHQMRAVAGGAVEVVLIGALVHRVLRMKRESPAGGDAEARIASAARALAGEGRVADVIASEVTVMYYALFCWRKQLERSDAHAFTFHERSGWSTIAICIVVMIVAESIGMHILLGLWSAKAAWIWTALDVWAILWIAGDHHGLRLKRSTVDAEMLHLRFGLRWNVDVPLDAVESISEITGEAEWKRRDVLKIAILDEPRWLIRFDRMIAARGLAGITKQIRAVAMLPDSDEAIEELRASVARRARA